MNFHVYRSLDKLVDCCILSSLQLTFHALVGELLPANHILFVCQYATKNKAMPTKT
jgi:hypothetical protein